MAVRRIRIDFYDDAGCRHTISLYGPVTREKIARVLDYAELMGGVSPRSGASGAPRYARTKFDRVRDLIVQRFHDVTFTSYQARELYEQFYGEPIPLTTMATYLSRLFDRALIRRSGSPRGWRYCLAEGPPTVRTD